MAAILTWYPNGCLEKPILHQTLIEVQLPIVLEKKIMVIPGIRQLPEAFISPRPRNYAVPSCRPNQRTGSVFHPQLVPGSGEGQNLSKEPKGTLCKI